MIDVNGYPYSLDDARGTLSALGPWWEQLSRGRELPTGFGALLSEQVDLLRRYTGSAITDVSLDTIDQLGRSALKQAGDDDASRDVLTASLALVHRAGDVLRAGGALPARASGVVVQLNRSGGGVPKLPVEEIVVDRTGVVGDVQHTRLHHGREFQALCLWSAEVIDAFAAEGHPLGYGAAGENVTMRGIPWGQVQAGVRLRIGEVLAEATPWALPCQKNAQWFLAGESGLMHHDRGPVSRVYAWVLEGGRIATGDEVVLEP